MSPLARVCQKVSGFSTILPVENVDKTVDVHISVINGRNCDRKCSEITLAATKKEPRIVTPASVDTESLRRDRGVEDRGFFGVFV